MAGLETAARLVGGAALLLANGFFVTTEFAMTRVPQFDRAEFEGHPGLERALEMTDRLEIYLSGCQVGITVSSVGLGFVAEPAVSAVVGIAVAAVGLSPPGGGHGLLSVALALGFINVLHVVVGEQAPTYLGVERSKLVARYCATPLYYWTTLTSPVIRLADWSAKGLLGLLGVTISRSWTEEELEGEPGETGAMTRRDLRREMGSVLARTDLPDERRREVLRALAIGETPVSELLVPAGEVIALFVEPDPEESLATMQANPQHTRFPLFDGEPADPATLPAESFVGVVYLPTVLAHVDALRAGEEELRDVAAPPVTLAPDTPVAEAIDRFQEERAELAVVVDDDRRVAGIVTATDAFEAITGQLEDPLDAATAGAT